MKKNITKNAKNGVFLLENENLEDLQCGGLQIIQNKNLYCFTSDSVILANFLQAKKNDFVVEIGTGCGVISILSQAKNDLSKIVAFEIQPQMAQLAERNVTLNKLGEKIEIICDDVQNFEKYFGAGKADVIFCNPPYFKPTNFPQTDVNKIAKEEVMLSCEQLAAAAAKMLKSGGSFYVCYPAERCTELVCTLQKHQLCTKELFFTENGKGKVKTIFLKAVKNGKFGTKVRPNLVTNEGNGDYLEILHTKNFLN